MKSQKTDPKTVSDLVQAIGELESDLRAAGVWPLYHSAIEATKRALDGKEEDAVGRPPRPSKKPLTPEDERVVMRWRADELRKWLRAAEDGEDVQYIDSVKFGAIAQFLMRENRAIIDGMLRERGLVWDAEEQCVKSASGSGPNGVGRPSLVDRLSVERTLSRVSKEDGKKLILLNTDQRLFARIRAEWSGLSDPASLTDDNLRKLVNNIQKGKRLASELPDPGRESLDAAFGIPAEDRDRKGSV